MELLDQHKCHGGWVKRFEHASVSTGCIMRFSVFVPPQAEIEDLPVVYWLSGLTCTDENFVQKAGAFKAAAELGLMLVMPDTSPRGMDFDGKDVPNDEAYDLGQGAGFYVNATQAPWKAHFHMYDYVVSELPELIDNHFPVNGQQAISGHSMGGHGALVIGLRNAEKYSSISAFSPICHPTNCPWGEKAFAAYLGDDKAQWQQYDASLLLLEADGEMPILVNQGTDDQFLEEQLGSQALIDAAEKSGQPLSLNFCQGYDHSYFFISSFIESHLKFHHTHFITESQSGSGDTTEEE
ncbi:S-formylglutathione hydrolase [Marinicella rhabdoformis]|uniref:S-formylglutathione hydrolase n=1 Tax=Marinicella rhabdoformis TaxID=2580566 RepID=UPI0012AEC5C5|nr:S-formylglutathione hydrolase [Marinicella rhabdoformis]